MKRNKNIKFGVEETKLFFIAVLPTSKPQIVYKLPELIRETDNLLSERSIIVKKKKKGKSISFLSTRTKG